MKIDANGHVTMDEEDDSHVRSMALLMVANEEVCERLVERLAPALDLQDDIEVHVMTWRLMMRKFASVEQRAAQLDNKLMQANPHVAVAVGVPGKEIQESVILFNRVVRAMVITLLHE